MQVLVKRLIILINHVNKWCVVKCGSKNGHQKDIHMKRDWNQKLLTILGPVADYSCALLAMEKHNNKRGDHEIPV